MQPTSIKYQTFLYFPKLPQELRDSIWRLCLPCRVVELDPLDARLNLETLIAYGSDSDIEIRPPKEHLMSRTSKLNAASPVISRVCREARRVAFEKGGFMDRPFENPSQPKRPRTWFDKERDVVHLHWNARIERHLGGYPRTDLLIRVESHMAAAMAGCSITRDVLHPSGHSTPWMKDRAVLERIGCFAVCFETVHLHAHEGTAIASGLFGMFGEERIILVDALDYDTLGKLSALWDAQPETQRDAATLNFFRQCHAHYAGSEAQRRRTQSIHDAVENIQKRWVLDYWDEQDELPGWLEREQVWLATPDWVPTRDLTKKRRQTHLRGYMALWVPNRDHPWMMRIYSRMPNFRPVIMFRLCTMLHALPKGTKRDNRLIT